MNKENRGRTYSKDEYDTEPWSVRTGSGGLILEPTKVACHANKEASVLFGRRRERAMVGSVMLANNTKSPKPSWGGGGRRSTI